VAEAWAIETVDLRKSYGDTEALRGLDLQVARGSLCGLLGRNGAGKTTTLKVLLGMTRPTSGTARVFGLTPGNAGESVRIRQRTGFVSEDKDLYEVMSVDEIVRFVASLYPTWRKDIEDRYRRVFGLPRDRRIQDLSRGMRTKLALLLALSRGAELLVLDEPTSGLDPAATEEVLQALVAHVGSDEVTVLLSSHHLQQIEQVADRIVIIDGGKAVVAGALEDLRDDYRRIQLVFDDAAPQPALRAAGVMRSEARGRVLTVVCRSGIEDVLAELRSLNAVAVEVMPMSLKEIFFESVNGDR
jgi:ABC-2 type transport system ATP-binding protein